MPAVFLHGGGDHAASRTGTFGRFVQAAQVSQAHPLALIIAEASDDDRATSFQEYSAIFQAVGLAADQIRPLFVTPTQPLTRAVLAAVQPSGVFVCGGATPFYHRALCVDSRWVAHLGEARIPYGGTSAGAAIAAQNAILGGWQAQ